MGILDKYVAKQVLFTIILVSFFLLILVALITFIDQMRYIGRGEIDFTFLIGYLGLQLPGIFVQFFPIAVLLGGVIGLGMMARSSELIIMQSVGISRAGIVLSALKLVFPVIILVAVMGEVLVPRIEQYAANQYNRYASNGNISITYDGLWIREGSSFIGVRYTMSDNSLLDIVRYDFNGDNLAAVSKAKTGSYENGSWVMHDVDKTLFEAGQVKPVHLERENWQLHLNPDRVQILGVKSANLTVEGLADYISYLEGNGQDSATFRLELYFSRFHGIRTAAQHDHGRAHCSRHCLRLCFLCGQSVWLSLCAGLRSAAFIRCGAADLNLLLFSFVSAAR